ncbi:MAG: hypothetical protein CM15mP12_0520 [Gammaproteobacteria bacterium]|nr:MAG: hypothetical protein CM15mP12_0520 [Gammaproteobacteria bacterium]
MGDVDGDGDIDVFMNAVLYFNDGNGDLILLISMLKRGVFIHAVELLEKKIDKIHAHASAMGDYGRGWF